LGALVFTVQPRTVFAGDAIAPPVEVTVLNGSGTRDVEFTGSVTIAIARNPGGGTLRGVASAPTLAGVARFLTLIIDRPGVGYTLTATAPDKNSATSILFDVVAATPSAPPR
jgi:hypothetical protein